MMGEFIRAGDRKRYGQEHKAEFRQPIPFQRPRAWQQLPKMGGKQQEQRNQHERKDHGGDPVLDHRCDHERGEKAQHHRGQRSHQLHGRLDHRANAAMDEFRSIDCAEQRHGDGEEQRIDGRLDGAEDERHQ
jgi:hypothetical protein